MEAGGQKPRGGDGDSGGSLVKRLGQRHNPFPGEVREMAQRHWFREYFEAILIAGVFLAFTNSYLVKTFYIPSGVDGGRPCWSATISSSTASSSAPSGGLEKALLPRARDPAAATS